MADGSVRDTKLPEFIHNAAVGMKGDYYMEFGIPRIVVGADTMGKYATQMASWARATLNCARRRGDNDEDFPGTFDDMLAAAEFLFQLAAGLEDAAAMLRAEKGGQNHG